MNLIAVDTETHLFGPQGTGKVNLRHTLTKVPIVCTTWAIAGEAGLIPWDDPSEVTALFDRDATFVFHNAAFDLGVLSHNYPELKTRLQHLVRQGRVLDTRVLYLLRDPSPPTRVISLAYIVRALFGYHMNKGAVRTSFRRGQKFSQEQKNYAKNDAILTHRVAAKLLETPLGSIRHEHTPQKILACRLLDGEDPDVVFSRAAANMAWNLVPVGMKVDQAFLQERHQEIVKKVHEHRERLVALGAGVWKRATKVETVDLGPAEYAPPGISRSWQLLDGSLQRVWVGRWESVEGYFSVAQKDLRGVAEDFAKCQHIVTQKTPTGEISLKRDHWRDYYRDLPEVLQAYMDYQKWNKYRTAFTGPLVDSGAEAVFPNYYVPGAATMRWSCSKLNLQQVPKGGSGRTSLRGLYVPRPGYLFVYADYPTLELYCLVQVMYSMGIDGPLRAALASGRDVHTATAALLFNVPESDVTKDMRFGAKAANFGLPGGMGAKRFHQHAKTLGIDWDFYMAQGVRNKWLNTYWDVKQYLAQLEVNPWALFYRGPGGADKKEWLLDIGFSPEDIEDRWPSAYEIIQKVADGRVYTVVLPTGVTIPDRGYSMAANAFFQGLGASAVTIAFNKLCETSWRICSVVHDSIMLEVPEELAKPAARDLNNCMKEGLREVCPDVRTPEMEVEVLDRWI